MTTEKDAASLVAEINASMQEMQKANKEINSALKASVEATGADAKQAIKLANELAGKIAAHADSIVAVEQKLAERVTAGKAAPETLGSMVVKSDQFKAFASGQTNKMRIEANTITGQSGSPATNNDTLNPSQRLPNYVAGAFRALRVADVIPTGVTNSNIVEYTRELSFTNAAAETAEGAAKPESTLTFELVSAPVRTIAHFLKVSKQALEDAAQLQSYIDTRLRYGVDLRFESQVVNGAGTGQDISGITASGNYTAFTPATGDTALDSLSRAIGLIRAANYEANAILMNPSDWGAIERLKDTANAYIVGNPLNPYGASLWGKPVVVTNTVTAGKLLVGAFDVSHQIFNRSQTVVEMFEQDDTNVQKNLLTVRGEKRGMLATFVPAAVYYGNLTL